MATTNSKTFFMVCPACGYLIEAKDIKIEPKRTDIPNKQCKNCKEYVGWSIYDKYIFPYIRGKKCASVLCEILSQEFKCTDGKANNIGGKK